MAAPIGPVNLEIIRRTLRFGWASGLCVGLGAVCIDVVYLLIFSLGLGAILHQPTIAVVLNLLGGLLLLWLGWGAVREAMHWWGRRKEAITEGAAIQSGHSISPPLLRSYGVGLAMTAANPMTIAFWSALSLQFVNLELLPRILSSIAVMAGCLSWVLLITTILTLSRERVGPRLFAVVTMAGGLMILYFGGRLLLRVAG